MSGYYQTVTRIKESAAPIDDVAKFAWNDDDYEECEEWIEYTPEELAEREANEARSGLAASDYVVIKAGEALLSCASIAELLATLADMRKAHRDILSARAKWRERLNELGAVAHGKDNN